MRNRTAVTAVALAAAAALALSACGSDGDKAGSSSIADVEASPKDKAATVLDQGFTKPDLVLTDTDGKKYDLREATKGKPTLIYFGYTNCPDVCPLTMSNISVAKRDLPKADQEKLQVVFVTTDPERDTPASLGKWLKAQDPTFIGLTGDFPTIQAAARQIGIGIEPATKEKDGTVVSMHGAQVVAFSPKTDGGYVLYGENTTAEEYAKDLPKLVKGENP
ncbi:redoxin domain-containing protein [Streptomyces sp. SID8359]|uniref:SCO family protein n=1 Tax=unclassified Streptomyces TaxID=2593676 RepID=UPI00048D6D03|nr:MULTISPECIES: SCO family protein [unclassified Streptomyces]MYT90097.1 redoxin domain-containing protein [Streptomyces sp. SID8359]